MLVLLSTVFKTIEESSIELQPKSDADERLIRLFSSTFTSYLFLHIKAYKTKRHRFPLTLCCKSL